MVVVQRFVLDQFNSNTFLCKDDTDTSAFLIDAGKFVVSSLPAITAIKYVFLTHGHFDHIKSLPEVLAYFPYAIVVAHAETFAMLINPKLNLSFFHGQPMSALISNTLAVTANDEMVIGPSSTLKFIPSPGHNPYALTYFFSGSGNLFTGDSYIPFVDVVTKLKGGNKRQAAESLARIRALLQPGMYIHPGHGPSFCVDASIYHDIDRQIKRLAG